MSDAALTNRALGTVWQRIEDARRRLAMTPIRTAFAPMRPATIKSAAEPALAAKPIESVSAASLGSSAISKNNSTAMVTSSRDWAFCYGKCKSRFSRGGNIIDLASAAWASPIPKRLSNACSAKSRSWRPALRRQERIILPSRLLRNVHRAISSRLTRLFAPARENGKRHWTQKTPFTRAQDA